MNEMSWKQETIGNWVAFRVLPETFDGPAASAPSTAPSDAPDDVGWSEEEVDYLADGALTVPGQGERPADCGDYMPLKYCQSCGEPHMFKRTCENRRCPNCASVWMGDHAEKGTVRVAAAREAADDGLDRRVVHAVVSPPEGEIETTGGYQRGKKHAQELAKRHGIRGGAVIAHGFRVTEEVKKEFRTLKEAGAVECGLWRWILTERAGQWREATYYSPHYHIIGFARDVEESSPADDGGWIVSNIRSVERHELYRQEPYDDLYGLFYYLLSHASYDPEASQHTIRWYGNVAYNKFSPEELEDRKESAVRNRAREARDDRVDEWKKRECDDEECEGLLTTIHDATDQLQRRDWCESIPDEKEERLVAAVDWLRGDVMPPPGLRHPRSSREADSALDELISRR